jgi:hypothetical protein
MSRLKPRPTSPKAQHHALCTAKSGCATGAEPMGATITQKPIWVPQPSTSSLRGNDHRALDWQDYTMNDGARASRFGVAQYEGENETQWARKLRPVSGTPEGPAADKGSGPHQNGKSTEAADGRGGTRRNAEERGERGKASGPPHRTREDLSYNGYLVSRRTRKTRKSFRGRPELQQPAHLARRVGRPRIEKP